MPLTEDIEGPPTTDVVFKVGGRPTTDGTDLNFAGQLTGLVLIPQKAPVGFSGCVRQCLETMSANTTGTSIIADSFDQQDRQLTLYGPAVPEVFQSVLRTATYQTLALDINIERIDVEVHDGVNSTVESVTVTQGVMQRRKRAVIPTLNEPAHQTGRHLLNYKDVTSENVEERETSASSLAFYWPFIAVALSSVGMLLAAVWLQRKRIPENWA